VAGNVTAFDVVDLTEVRGGVDQQTSAAQLAIDQATAAISDVAKAVAPKDTGMSQALMAMLNHRRAGPGPTPAPALPPTSTLTR